MSLDISQSRGCGTAHVGIKYPTIQNGFSLHHSCYLYFLFDRAVWLDGPLFFVLFFFFPLRGENCGKYFVFPGSQAMYLLQVLLNEL